MQYELPPDETFCIMFITGWDTSTRFVKVHFCASECAGNIVFIDLFDLYHLLVFLEVINLRFHEHDPSRRAECKLDVILDKTLGRSCGVRRVFNQSVRDRLIQIRAIIVRG